MHSNRQFLGHVINSEWYATHLPITMYEWSKGASTNDICEIFGFPPSPLPAFGTDLYYAPSLGVYGNETWLLKEQQKTRWAQICSCRSASKQGREARNSVHWGCRDGKLTARRKPIHGVQLSTAKSTTHFTKHKHDGGRRRVRDCKCKRSQRRTDGRRKNSRRQAGEGGARALAHLEVGFLDWWHHYRWRLGSLVLKMCACACDALSYLPPSVFISSSDNALLQLTDDDTVDNNYNMPTSDVDVQ